MFCIDQTDELMLTWKPFSFQDLDADLCNHLRDVVLIIVYYSKNLHLAIPIRKALIPLVRKPG